VAALQKLVNQADFADSTEEVAFHRKQKMIRSKSMDTQKFLWAIIVVLLLSTLACGLGGSDSDKAGAVVAAIPTEAPAETTESVIEDIEEVAEKPTAMSEPVEEAVEFPGTNDLNALSAHRITYVQESDGVNTADEPAIIRVEIFVETTQEPFAKHHVQKNIHGALTEDAPEATIVYEGEDYHVDGVSYMYNKAAGDMWITSDGMDRAFLSQGFNAPETLLYLPTTGLLSPEPEEINGILTHHYSFSEADNIIDEWYTFTGVKGDVWIAVKGNYVVKYELEGEIERTNIPPGQEDLVLFKSGYVGVQFELSDANGDFTITPPAEATGE
jgi:hypothetical protein